MKFTSCIAWSSGVLQKLTFLPAILTRITIGFVFIGSGWGKLHHLDKTIEYFASIGIPAAHLQAPFAAAAELLCGSLVLFGIATRFASFPLIIVMLVAIRTAKWDDVTGVSSLFEISEYLYIVLLSWLATHGAGPVSIDHLLRRLFWHHGKEEGVNRELKAR